MYKPVRSQCFFLAKAPSPEAPPAWPMTKTFSSRVLKVWPWESSTDDSWWCPVRNREVGEQNFNVTMVYDSYNY